MRKLKHAVNLYGLRHPVPFVWEVQSKNTADHVPTRAARVTIVSLLPT